MAKDSSFDIVSEVDMQVIDDCINVTKKEISNRFDLKSLDIVLDFNREEKTITISTTDDFSLSQVKEVLFQKMIKRELSMKCLTVKKKEQATGGTVREINDIVNGIDKELAKTITKDIRNMKLRVTASIQEEKIRVAGAKRDDLQEVINMIKEKDYTIPLQFINYR